MATETFKVLGQLKPAATTLTDLYTVPASTMTTVSSLFVANQSSSKADIRVSIAVAGVSDSLEQYIYYDVEIPGNDSLAVTAGITMGATDVMRVYATTADVSFNLFGVEITS